MAITYEYLCTDKECNNSWEEDQGINDPRITICPKCGKETAMRLISNGSGFILSGDCWGRDNYSSKKD